MTARVWDPVLSIIVPTFNRRFYLEICLRSILRQSFEDYEIIVIDDGSDDETDQLLHHMVDSRIIHIRQANRGEYAATNLGLRAASGELLTWVHSDDLLPEGSLEKRARALEEDKEIDFCHGDINWVDPLGRVLRLLPAVDWSARHTFDQYLVPAGEREIHFMVHYSTMMFRRDLLDRIGFMDETLPYAGDLEWMLRALKHGQMKRVPEVLYHYRRHERQRCAEAGSRIDIDHIVQSIVERHADEEDPSTSKVSSMEDDRFG